jgi:hypothetical protein
MLIYHVTTIIQRRLTLLLLVLTEDIADSGHKNALVEFEEGDSELSSYRCFYVAFWGELESGRSETGRLTGNEDYSQLKVRVLTHPYDNTTPSLCTFIYRALWNWTLSVRLGPVWFETLQHGLSGAIMAIIQG